MANEYPEHEKLRGIKQKSQTIGEFIEWLQQHGYFICEERKANGTKYGTFDVPEQHSRRAYDLGDAFCDALRAVANEACVYWPTFKRLPEALLAEYFDIDEKKLDDEKRAMLDRMRGMQPLA